MIHGKPAIFRDISMKTFTGKLRRPFRCASCKKSIKKYEFPLKFHVNIFRESMSPSIKFSVDSEAVFRLEKC